MENIEYNPLRLVNGVKVPCPKTYKWQLEDVSDSDAGRTEDLVMEKKRIGQVVKIELSWSYVDDDTAKQILQAFNDEYITIEYKDAMRGWRECEFYVGNRNAPMYNSKKGLWENISFNIIERKAVLEECMF